jgi:predicted DNA-binding transcriptional regulator YafY
LPEATAAAPQLPLGKFHSSATAHGDLEHWRRAPRIPLVECPVASTPPDSPRSGEDGVIRNILQAIDEGARVSFAYYGGTEPGERRTVSPASLFRVQDYVGAIYLAGYCHTRHENRTFRLDRMHEVQPCPRQQYHNR